MAEINRIVVTGAAGYLGSNLIPALLADGFEVTGVDRLAPVEAIPGCRYIDVDLANVESTRAALAGAELICHVASVHPWKPYTDEQYIDANIKGTWNLYKCAAELGIGKVVLTSSIAGAGYGFQLAQWPINEEAMGTAPDIYTYTKMAQELNARSAAINQKIQTFALRPPAFMPKPNLDIGFGLTGNYGVVGDVVAAHLAATRVLAGRQPAGAPAGMFEAFFTTNRLNYTTQDFAGETFNSAVTQDALRRRYPQAADFLIAKGFSGMWLAGVYELSKAKAILHWEPKFNLEQWFSQNASM